MALLLFHYAFVLVEPREIFKIYPLSVRYLEHNLGSHSGPVHQMGWWVCWGMSFIVIKDAGMTDWKTKYDGHDPNPFANQEKAQFPIFGGGQRFGY